MSRACPRADRRARAHTLALVALASLACPLLACGRSDLLVAPPMTGGPFGSDDDGTATSDEAPDDGSEPDAPNGVSLPGSIDAAAVTSAEASAPEEGALGRDGASGATPPAAGDASTTCMSLGVQSTVSGPCESHWGETCGGVNYQVDCSCARGSCVCFGPTTHVVAYSGCPLCPDRDNGSAFALCGFPWGGP